MKSASFTSNEHLTLLRHPNDRLPVDEHVDRKDVSWWIDAD